MDSRFRGNDEKGGNDEIGGNDGLSFADFHRQTQLHLFSSIDNALSQKAESIITDNFAAVKKAGIQLQTKLGGRKGNIGVNLIGAFAETDNRAFGWQLRAYGGQDSVKGANAGVFYRTIDNGALYGANAFLDYEDGDYGGFSRFGIGGEIKHAIVALAANYYLPITDERNVNSTIAAFSRQGFDAKLRISAPNFDRLKVAVDYYNFDGERGAKADDGLRYGVEVSPIPALHVGLFYDDGAEKFGGDIAYSHTIGEVQARYNGGETFAPDLFAAISREYSQRVATAAIGPGISLSIRVVGVMTNTMTAAAITTTTRMTVAEFATTMTARMTTSMANTRVASVLFTVRQDVGGSDYHLATTSAKLLLTLPPATTPRPHVLVLPRSIQGDLIAALVPPNSQIGHIIETTGAGGNSVGDSYAFGYLGVPWTITITEGSEDFISSVTTTLTTRTSTTMAAVSTTTTMTMMAITTTATLTTFATTTITLTANAAINLNKGDSRFRGNDEGNGNTPLMPPPSKMPKMAMSNPPIPISKMPQMASADIPIIHHQKQAHYRHSRPFRHKGRE